MSSDFESMSDLDDARSGPPLNFKNYGANGKQLITDNSFDDKSISEEKVLFNSSKILEPTCINVMLVIN